MRDVFCCGMSFVAGCPSVIGCMILNFKRYKRYMLGYGTFLFKLNPRILSTLQLAGGILISSYTSGKRCLPNQMGFAAIQ